MDKGFLPIFSVNTDEEANALLIRACKFGLNGEYIVPELAEEQTLENLYDFGDRLRAIYKQQTGRRKTTRRA